LKTGKPEVTDAADLDTIDRGLLSNGWCCDCGSELLPGPRGGAAQNFYCINRDDCRAGFNLTFHSGVLVFAQRIGEVDDARFAMWQKKL
jgi:hypothetical protein